MMFTSLALGVLGLATQALSIATIEAKGSKFFLSTGEQFFIKGVAYQLIEDDPLANPSQCKLDAALMKTLGANSIRVYHVVADSDHDECMSTFADAGIYVWLDLDTFDTYVIEGSGPQWTQTMYSAYSAVMDAFHGYDNVAGFFVANELLNAGSDSVAAPYVKAAARDMKAYRDNKGYRSIPVGYSAADIAQLRPNLQNYMACGDDASARLDFFSLNAYEWCGDSTYEVSGYSQLQANASEFNIPIFFSETGCNVPTPRNFGDQAAIFGSEMSDTWSGAIIYEWIQETNNYGIVNYGTPAGTAAGTGVVAGYTRTGTPTPISPDFENLSTQWANAQPSSVSMSAYNPSHSAPACPSYTSGLWEVSGNVALPTVGQAVSKQTSSATATSGSSAASSASSGATAASSAKSAASSGSSTVTTTLTSTSTHSSTSTSAGSSSTHSSSSSVSSASPSSSVTAGSSAASSAASSGAAAGSSAASSAASTASSTAAASSSASKASALFGVLGAFGLFVVCAVL